MKILKLFLGLLLLSASVANAAPNTPVTENSELVGCWERIDFSEDAKKKINEIEPWPSRYQWYCFDGEGTMHSLHSTHAKAVSASELNQAFAQFRGEGGFKWKLLPNSIIQTTGKDGRENLYWAAGFMSAAIRFDEKTLEKGTLIMSLYDQSKNRPVYWRYLKRVQ